MGTERTNFRGVLLAEDDARDVEMILAALTEHDLADKVTVTSDGAEALDYLYRRGKYESRPTGHPSVVVLDLKMPKVNGLEVLRAIKADPKLQTIPVVMFSSSRETLDLIACYGYGVNAYVVKPVDFAEFVKAVEQLVIFWAATNVLPAYPRETVRSKPSGAFIPAEKIGHPE